MKPTVLEVRNTVNGLPEGFDVDIIGDAWYSARTLTRAFSSVSADELHSVSVVRVFTPRRGCIELHPNDDGTVSLMCYCCFGGDPEKGTVPLESLRDALVALKDHNCPPWPG